MKQLEYLRNRLTQLGGRRLQFRRATALSALVIAVLTALAVIFALDWSFQRSDDLLQRLFLIALGAVAVAWAVRRYALPALARREDCMEMALLVERHASIDSDLVAALQFESPDAPQWGSAQLETAVIENVASRQKRFDFAAMVPWRPLISRLKVLGAAIAIWALVTAFYPDHVRVFFNRVLLGSEHYPTQTKLVALTVYGKSIDLASPQTAAIRVPYGRRVKFEATALGGGAVAGRVELVGDSRGQAAVVSLEPAAEEPKNDDSRIFKGEYERLVQTVQYRVYVGDAWTDSFTLEVIPAPIIGVEPEIVLPRYARTEDDGGVQQLPRGTNQFAVLEGSAVHLKIHSDRRLKSVLLTCGGDKPIAMAREGEFSTADGELWAPAIAGTPLAAVVDPLRYSIQVTDADDAALERPIEGFVRIEPDKAPRVAAAIKTRYILPGAKPTIYYKATDDYALSRIWLTWEVNTSGQAPVEIAKPEAASTPKQEAPPAKKEPTGPATAEEIAAAIKEGATAKAGAPQAAKPEVVLYSLADPAEAEWSLEGGEPFDIGPLGLKAGDTLKVTVHAMDYRGERPGKTTHAEPVVFNVTDEQGVMHSLQEDDQKSASQIEAIINNLLGIGGSP